MANCLEIEPYMFQPVCQSGESESNDSHADTDSDTDGDMYRGLPGTPASATLVRVYEVGLAFRHGCAQSRPRPVCLCGTSRVALRGWYVTISDFLAIVVLKARYLNIEEANMADSAISNLLRTNVGAGLARVSLNKNIIRNYFSLVFSVDKRAFKRMV